MQSADATHKLVTEKRHAIRKLLDSSFNLSSNYFERRQSKQREHREAAKAASAAHAVASSRAINAVTSAPSSGTESEDESVMALPTDGELPRAPSPPIDIVSSDAGSGNKKVKHCVVLHCVAWRCVAFPSPFLSLVEEYVTDTNVSNTFHNDRRNHMLIQDHQSKLQWELGALVVQVGAPSSHQAPPDLVWGGCGVP